MKAISPIRMRCLFVFLITTLIAVCCSGCWSRVEIERMSFVSVVGVDRAGEDLLVSFQIVVPRSLAKEGGGGGEPPVFVLSVKERTIPDALAKISQESPRVVRFKQLDAIVLGEDLGKEGAGHVMDFFARHWEMRRSIWVLMAHGSAQEVLLKGAPVQEKVPGSAIKMMMEREDRLAPTHYPIMLGDFINNLSREGVDAIISAVHIRPMQEKKAGVSVEERESEEKKVTAERKEMAFQGAGVFRGDKLVGYLGPHETRGVRSILGKLQGGIYTVPTPSQGIWASLVTDKSSARIKPVVTKDKISFQIEIRDEGYV